MLIGVVSQAGDLFESHLKRHFGVKDFGSMIPGHGGLLDRLDAVLDRRPGGGPTGVGPRTWSSSLGMNAVYPSSLPSRTRCVPSRSSAARAASEHKRSNCSRRTPDRFRVRALVAGRNAALLAEQAMALRAEIAVVADPSAYATLRDALAGTGIEAAAGTEAVVAAASLEADWTMAAITGAAGLASTLAAIRRGAFVGLANKEALVCAGDVMLRAVREAGATLLPVELRNITRSSSRWPTAIAGPSRRSC